MTTQKQEARSEKQGEEPLRSFKDLRVWRKAMDLGVAVYEVTKAFPKAETYGLSNQLQRAIISVSSNIAEGFDRQSVKEKVQFYNIAHSSLAEVESQVEIAFRLKYIGISDYEKMGERITEVSKMITGLSKSLTPHSSLLASPRATRAGFTLVELLVAITLFSIAVSVAVGGFVRALRTQRELVALIAANSNASLAIEQMAREMRTGAGFSVSPAGDSLSFVNANEESVAYSLDKSTGPSSHGVLLRTVGNNSPQPVTASNVNIKYLTFTSLNSSQYPPRITINIGVSGVLPELQGNVTNIQTTVSSRAF